jgi:nucleotide-binding universal stress UspA family protein
MTASEQPLRSDSSMKTIVVGYDGTHPAERAPRLLGGSVSQGVARRAHCDVLIVHPPDEPGASHEL